MKIAVEGCAHGELDKIYGTLKLLEERNNEKIDLVICCGDFQAVRNPSDLLSMAVPAKFRHMCSFYKYYSGEKVAPYLTIFIGGNHEASNYLQELPYGGWVAPNIYYMGYSGAIRVGGVRIAGLSGIYKRNDYLRGRFEYPPYDEDTKRSVYHVRNLDVFRLKQLTPNAEGVDIFLSHDWPTDVWKHGNVNQLLRFKPFFKKDIDDGTLGSPVSAELLSLLKPTYWLAAHLHCKFSAVVQHEEEDTEDNNKDVELKYTKFLSLDKCLPRRRFLQLIEVPHEGSVELSYDLEWLTILRSTNHLINTKSSNNYLPNSSCLTERFEFRPTDEEKATTASLFNDDLVIPKNFEHTALTYSPKTGGNGSRYPSRTGAFRNAQTVKLCEKLGVSDPLVLLGAFARSSSVLDDSTPNNSVDESYETFLMTSPNKLSNSLGPLDLPEPKSDECDSLFFTDLDGKVESGEEGSSPERKLKLEKFEKFVGVQEEGPVKKFKRRNGSIYAGAAEEDD